jgi:citronellol/citronellal dehydrogenase
MTKVALITGATRGIGRALAIGLAKNGYDIVVTGKSVYNKKSIPGTIFTVSSEIKKLGRKALPVQLDVQNYDDIENLFKKIEQTFGRLDLVINNAGALFWKNIDETNPKNYDLINNINSRGAFFISKLAIPLMIKSGGGHIINQSPPLSTNFNEFKQTLKGKTAYMISKWGMTLGALGLSEELKEKHIGIGVNTIWPNTPIESYAVINNKLGDKSMWRTTDITLDCVLEIIKENPKVFTGNQLIDETYLRSKGTTDFSKYQCVSGSEPPKLNDINHLFKSKL